MSSLKIFPTTSPSCMSSVPASYFVDGFQLPAFFLEESFLSALQYTPIPGDLFLVSYPKCGSTWTQHLVSLLLRGGEPFDEGWVFQRDSPHIEFAGPESVAKMRRPGCIKSHFPFHLMPWSDHAKYIYISRNPKDTCVSYYHHTRGVLGHRFNGTFEQYFELFIKGNVDFGDYFDHLRSWYEHRNKPNVLFLTYEEMKENLSDAILKIASFVDHERYALPLIEDRSKLDFITNYCSFDQLKRVLNRLWMDTFSMTAEEIEKSGLPEPLKEAHLDWANIKRANEGDQDPFVICRKGIIGDWRNYFSEEQNKRMNEKIAEKTKDTDIINLWKKYM